MPRLIHSILLVLPCTLAGPASGGERTCGLILNEADAFPGYTLFAPLNSTRTYLIDNEGLEVNAWDATLVPGDSVYLNEDGELVRTARLNSPHFNAGGAGGLVERYDWEGALEWSYQYSSNTVRLHHDIELLPNGNILMIAWEHKTRPQAIGVGRDPALLGDALWPDHIIEVAPSPAGGGAIVWEWHAWDHLVQSFDPARPNYVTPADMDLYPHRIDVNFQATSSPDWLHVNAIDYNAELDQIVLSVPTFGEVWIIRHDISTEAASGAAGDLIYRWGNPQAYGRGGAAAKKLFAQHDVKWVPSGSPGEGNLTIFNNGAGRPGGAYSSIEEISPPLEMSGMYTLPPTDPFGPVAPTWQYTADPTSDFYSTYISGAHRLPNGNTLICSGAWGDFFEVTEAADTVWHYINPVVVGRVLDYDEPIPSGENRAFRATRLAVDFAGFDGQDMTPGDPIEGQTCTGDITGLGGTPDGTVDIVDLLAILDAWGTNGLGADLAEPEDLVTTDDILVVLASWGTCPD